MAVTKILARKGRLDVGIRYVLNGGKTQEQILTAISNGNREIDRLQEELQYQKERTEHGAKRATSEPPKGRKEIRVFLFERRRCGERGLWRRRGFPGRENVVAEQE